MHPVPLFITGVHPVRVGMRAQIIPGNISEIGVASFAGRVASTSAGRNRYTTAPE
jgi:hypothetical protein